MLSSIWLMALAASGTATEVHVHNLAGQPVAGATLSLFNARASPVRELLVSTSDAAGLLTVTQEQLQTVCPPPPRCPPGAPCAAPPICAPFAVARAKGFIEARFNPLSTPQVRLVPEKAKVATEAAALAAVSRSPRWKAWVGAREYGKPVVALDADGNWRVSVESVSWPIFLPPQSAMVDPLSAAVTPLSCPVQGSHLLVSQGPVLEDVATGYRYQCDGPQEPRCAPLMKPGATLVVASYGVRMDSCEGSLQVGTKDASTPPVECGLVSCHKVK